ncbi:MAG: CspA family cold shock protein [Candidatus Azotimanducaceae bacterium]|jgi:CspA family cold shock protein
MLIVKERLLITVTFDSLQNMPVYTHPIIKMDIMNPILKNIILSLIIGSIAYFISQIFSGSVHVPTEPEFGVLAIFILAVFLGRSVLPATSSKPTRRNQSKPAARQDSKPASQAKRNSNKEAGTVKWFNIKKGFGFITRDEGDDIFVHYRNIEGNGRRAINEGQRVKFLVIDGDKGLQADEVEAE